MTTLELQEQLISKIQITTDEDILQGVLRFLQFETETDEIYILNEEQQQAITKARLEVSNGQFYTNEEVDKLTEEWLRK